MDPSRVRRTACRGEGRRAGHGGGALSGRCRGPRRRRGQGLLAAFTPMRCARRSTMRTCISVGWCDPASSSPRHRAARRHRALRQGITYRLEHLAGGQVRDRQRMAEVLPLEQRYARSSTRSAPAATPRCSTSDGSSRSSRRHLRATPRRQAPRPARVSSNASPPPSAGQVENRAGEFAAPTSARRIADSTNYRRDTIELLQTLIRNECMNDVARVGRGSARRRLLAAPTSKGQIY